MLSFPQIRDLPPVVETTGWHWTRFEAPVAPSHNFWVGTDRQGNRWLTKLNGDFCAYREIVFGRLAQSMNWSCQSSVFMRLDADSARLLRDEPGAIHAAHWFLDEHLHPPCGDKCDLAPLVNKPICSVEDLENLGISHILDWPKSELAACLFGGTEPPGRLFTSSHEFVIIDSELMFASGPCSFDSTIWWGRKFEPEPSGYRLAVEVCNELLALGHSGIENALTVPTGVSVQERWPIAPLLFKSFSYAHSFCVG